MRFDQELPTVTNQNLFGLSTSATLAINERSRALMDAGKKVYRFGFGQSPFPVPNSVVESLREHAHEKDYLPVQGLPALREALASFINSHTGTRFKSSQFLIGPGSKELMFLLQLSYYGELVIPAPSWVSYAPQAQIIGRHVRRLDTLPENGLLIMPDELEALCEQDPSRPRLLVLNYPANPTGTTYSEDNLRDLAMVARKYRIIVLSDEIYSELNFQDKRVSIAYYYPEGTIISGGLSKWCGAGGWRLGFFAFPEGLKRLQDAMTVCASETFTSTSAPIQYAATTAFKMGPDIQEYLKTARFILRDIGYYMHRKLVAAGITMPKPEGGFYLFPSFAAHKELFQSRGIETDRDMCQALLEEAGVALLPGVEFGCSSDLFAARLSYVDFDGAAVLEAATGKDALDDAFIETHCPQIAEGAKAICDWLKK
ncbi:MAG: aminotransferase class I/II-fold pyridoxal phosphate-dependent enzyme [Saprospiraceae bacterium]